MVTAAKPFRHFGTLITIPYDLGALLAFAMLGICLGTSVNGTVRFGVRPLCAGLIDTLTMGGASAFHSTFAVNISGVFLRST